MAIIDSIGVAGMVGALVLGAMVGACGSADPGPGATGAPSGAGGASFGGSACGTCVKTACTSEISACGADPECAAYYQCLEACPLGSDGNADPTCSAACPKAAGSAGKKAQADLTLCRSEGAGTKCAPCGAVVQGDNPVLHQTCPAAPRSNKCFECEDEKCCQTEAAEMANPEAKAIVACVGACSKGGGKNCTATCAAQHPGGVADFAALEACMLSLCAIPACNNNMPIDPCVECGNQNCANSYANLQTDPAGFALYNCSLSCNTDAGCYAACEKKYPSAVSLFEEWQACGVAKCTAQCG